MARPFYINDEFDFTGLAASAIVSDPAVATVNGTIVAMISEGDASVRLLNESGELIDTFNIVVIGGSRPSTYLPGLGNKIRQLRIRNRIYNTAFSFTMVRYAIVVPEDTQTEPLVPTDFTTNGGGTVFVSSVYNEMPTLDGPKAFDGDENTRWAAWGSQDTQPYIEYALPTGTYKRLSEIKIKPAANEVKDVVVLGSNDNGGSYIVLGSIVVGWEENLQSFPLDSLTGYNRIKLRTKTSYNGTNSSIWTLQLWGTDASSDSTPANLGGSLIPSFDSAKMIASGWTGTLTPNDMFLKTDPAPQSYMIQSSSQNGAELGYKFDSIVAFGGYSITGHTYDSNPYYEPETWSVYGSVDNGTTWDSTPVHVVTSARVMANGANWEPGAKRTYALPETVTQYNAIKVVFDHGYNTEGLLSSGAALTRIDFLAGIS